MTRSTQRDILPTATQSRNLAGNTIAFSEYATTSVTLSAGSFTTIAATVADIQGAGILTVPDITLYEGSIAAANQIPNGSSITPSDYQIVGPWQDERANNGSDTVTKVYLRNVATVVSKQIAADQDDGTNATGAFDPSFVDIGFNINNDSAAFRFQSVAIPQGVTITTATLTGTIGSVASASVASTIYGFKTTNLTGFTTGEDISARTMTTANVSWTIPNNTINTTTTSPDIKTILQEIVNQGSWASGNALGFFIQQASSDDIEFYDYSASPSKSMQLSVTYSSAAKTVIIQVQARSLGALF